MDEVLKSNTNISEVAEADDSANNHEDHDIFNHINNEHETSIDTMEADQSNVPIDAEISSNVIEEVLVEETVDDQHIESESLLTPPNAVLSTTDDRTEQDEMFQEEEISRILTTLESTKKATEKEVVVNEAEEETEEYMEVIIEHDAQVSSAEETENYTNEPETTDPGELARRQLEKMEQTKKVRQPKSNGESSPKKEDLIQNMKNALAQKFVTPHKNNPKQTSPGIIEIPKELLSGSEDLNASVLHNAETPLKREDLLAILEGSDDEASTIKKSGLTDKEYEKQLALKQIMSLPPKPKGRRPKPKPEGTNSKAEVTKSKQKTEASKQSGVKPGNDLVSSLVQDWSGGSDSDSKTEEEPQPSVKKPKVLKKKSPEPSAKAPSPDPPIAFKRSRIIKKKIIWDPDAPETAISYASLIQPSAAFIKKTQQSAAAPKKAADAPRILNKLPAQSGNESSNDKSNEALRKKRVSSASPIALKKRKVSEIDKLLGDEGAANMLNALKQENNNTDMSEQETSLETRTELLNSPIDSTSDDKNSQRVARSKRPQTPQRPVQQPNATVKKEPVKRKKATNAGSKAWDYIYSNRDDDSLIIRRRSNSSYSSSASNTRTSLDAPSTTKPAKATKGNKAGRKALARAKESQSFEFAKPNARKSIQSPDSGQSTILMDIQRPKSRPLSSSGESPTGSSGRKISNSSDSPKDKKSLTKSESFTISKQKVSKTSYQEIRIERDGGLAQIILEPFSDKLQNVFTLQLMREVCKALLTLDDDVTCKVVLITSATATFCNGLDYSSLVQVTQEKRKSAAAELSTEVGKFIESLASFRKTLIAGVHGHVVGIGVTILPLFDLVLANANSTFETPYARIGQVPEGCSVLLLSNKVNQNAKSELLLLGETLDAASAHGHSLVTKIIHTNGFEAELQRQVSLVTQFSVQALEATKAVIHTAELAALPVRLADELKVLQQHWISTECQYNIKQYILTNKW